MSQVEALRAVIDAENAAIWGYGVVAGQLSGRAESRARRALLAHRRWRDRWASLLVSLGQQVPPTQPAYRLPFPVDRPAAARTLAAVLDERMVGWYADLAAASAHEDRTAAVQAARECAVRAVSWGAPSQAFPGETDD